MSWENDVVQPVDLPTHPCGLGRATQPCQHESESQQPSPNRPHVIAHVIKQVGKRKNEK